MAKLSVNTGHRIRATKDICLDFLDYLIEQKLIPEEQKQYYSTDGLGEVLELLVDKLYETEYVDNVQVSTINAFYIWCRFVIKQDPSTKRDVWNELVKQLFVDIEHHRFSCILVGRGHGKSFFIGALYITFKMWIVSGTQIAYIANVPQMTKRVIRLFKEIVKNNELLLEKMNPGNENDKEFVWTQTELQYNRGFLETTTAGGQIRSAHVNFLFFDDLLRDDNIYSPEDYQKFVFEQALPIVNAKRARMVLLGTPQSLKDVYHTCMRETEDDNSPIIRDGRISARGFYSVAYPIVKDWDSKKILLPELYTIEDIQRIIKIQGERAFWKEYMLVCSDSSNRIFSQEIIDRATSIDVKLDFQPKQGRIYLICADVATAGTASADYSVFFVLEIERTNTGMKKIVKWIIRTKGMMVTAIRDVMGNIIEPGQVDTLEELSKHFNNALVVVEKNNVGVTLIQELGKRNVNVEAFTTTSTSKPGIIRYLVSEMTNGNLIIPKEGELCQKLRYEMENFGVVVTNKGNEQLKALSGKDDMVMSLAIGNDAASRLHFGQSFS